MRTLPLAVAGACLVAVVAGPPSAALRSSPLALPMTVAPVAVPSSLGQFPVYDAAGTLLRDATYRVTPAGGNCCEVALTATADGRLLDLGGSVPVFSDDGGVTWSSATPPLPVVNGEGAIAAAPGGAVVGIAWDAYSGDRLMAYRYTPAEGWTYHENPWHAPFFDRPWVTVVKGPFALPDGGTAPWASIVRAGSSLVRETELVSYDGLVYHDLALPVAAAALPADTAPLPVVADADTDRLQAHSQSLTSPLPGGGAIRLQDRGLGCPSGLMVLRSTVSWACLDLGGTRLTGDVRADGRGWLHEVVYGIPGDTELGRDLVTYRVSTDGGATWRSTVYRLPGDRTDTKPDVKVDSARHRTYVALRAIVPSGQQDMVLAFDHTGGTPALDEVFHVGLGDLLVGSDIAATGPRMDFASIVVLPDGRFAVAYDDSTTRTGTDNPQPWVAVLQ
ncbi:MAG TPA: hypothetical protein VF519_19030 [Mycobacteriales bacterium]|jgi:hypothetical protein